MNAHLAVWRKSSRSGLNGCLEVAVDGPAVLLRSSRDPQGPRLTLSLQEFAAFLDGAKAGEFDLPGLSAGGGSGVTGTRAVMRS